MSWMYTTSSELTSLVLVCCRYNSTSFNLTWSICQEGDKFKSVQTTAQMECASVCLSSSHCSFLHYLLALCLSTLTPSPLILPSPALS